MSNPIKFVYYSIQRAGNYGTQSLPINTPAEKAALEVEAKHTVTVTSGDLRLVVFVCGEFSEDETHQQINHIKDIYAAMIPVEMKHIRSRYSEIDGQGYIDGEPVEDFDEDELE